VVSVIQKHSFLVCPICKQQLQIEIEKSELYCIECTVAFPTQMLYGGCEFTSFAKTEADEIKKNEIMYDASNLNERYQNFLNWLFQTFKVEEETFRRNMFKNLKISKNMNVLITSVGNGDDIINLVRMFPDMNLNIYAQDISVTMCEFALSRLRNLEIQIREMNISDLAALPYKSNFFDVVFHFGGINWISDKAGALSEMVRVAKDFGQIGISDESVAPWLRNSVFGKMMINNNSLWSAEIPLDILPTNINKVKVEYLLENCFYFISFIKDPKFPNVDLDVRHIGPRGGSIRTRFFGKIEGIDPLLGEAVRRTAIAKGMSEADWLEMTLRKEISQRD
jgi:ubiquinone/menaquinone biosynthesis C-methylase UbiE